MLSNKSRCVEIAVIITFSVLVHYTIEDFPSVLGTRTSVHAWLLIPMRKIVYKSSPSSSLKKVSAKVADMYEVV